MITDSGGETVCSIEIAVHFLSQLLKVNYLDMKLVPSLVQTRDESERLSMLEGGLYF